MKINSINRLWLWLIIFGAGLSVAVYFAGYHLFVAPLNSKAEELEKQLAAQQSELEEGNAEPETDRLESSASYQQQLPVTKELDRLLVMIEKTALETGSVINEIALTTEENSASSQANEESSLPEHVNSFRYQLEVSASSYENMYTFLAKIEKADRLVNIDSLAFNTKTDNGIEFSFIVSAFYTSGLDILMGETSIEEYEKPAEKTNPFSD
ncbi:type 4a pilus biogenesis protein PilO [Sediminibacillus albus]|uniref:Tfp pilus assembly protein PilO n=1 Tax=Sediminibacillus albus TaxID=407036 RepID=A0A1G9BNR9_9BACI|nr:type 4a pilus biogenesis protein PilO [Sediminibacillus albus]SDK40900.1 Tfp pilus assembly protein PilO [Sediminibacillus albus]